MINDEQIKNLLKNSKTIAVVGASEDSSKPSNRVFNYLKGIETIPLFYKYFTEMFKES